MIQVKKLNDKAKLPTRGSDGAAGYDIYAAEYVAIQPKSVHKVHTGISVIPPEGYFCALFARSGLAVKNGLRPANCVGVCDEDYRGEYIVALYNDSDKVQEVQMGDRIAQMVILPYLVDIIVGVDKLPETPRGKGGFGSTGV